MTKYPNVTCNKCGKEVVIKDFRVGAHVGILKKHQEKCQK